MKSKRMYQSERQEMREQMIAYPNRAANGFVSKVICYRKNWQQNAANGVDVNDVQRINLDDEYDFSADYEPEDLLNESILKTVWNRDITAAKLIMYKGKLVIGSELVFGNWDESEINKICVCFVFLFAGHCELFGEELHRNFTVQRLVYPEWIRIDVNAV